MTATRKSIIGEFETLDALIAGASIARFGDGELRLAMGGSLGHQIANKRLREELLHILNNKTKCLVGVPHVHPDSPRKDNWRNYVDGEYRALYSVTKQYHSSFITRPDSAPWIDTPEYWAKIPFLWEGKNVVIVRGETSRKSFQEKHMTGATSVREVLGPAEHAYEHIDRIEAECAGADVAIIGLGATATSLAWRLAEKGQQALDLGHMGLFMKRRGLLNV